MADLTNSEPYYDQISHAARPGTRYVVTTGTAITTPNEFAGIYVVTDTKFISISSAVTGFSSIANATAASASTINAGIYLAGTCTAFSIHSGIVLGIGD
jgi:hypothetical protein